MRKSNPFAEIDRQASAKLQKVESSGSEDEEDFVPLANKTRQGIEFRKNASNKKSIFDDDDDSMDTDSSGAVEDGDDEDIESEEDEQVKKLAELREKVKDMPLAKVREIRDKIGLKLWESMVESGSTSESNRNQEIESDHEDSDDSDDDDAPKEIKKKKSQNAPREMSSKRPVSVFRQLDVGANKKKHSVDPRFSSRSGEYIESEFVKDYDFLYDMQQNDLKNLTKEMKKAKKTNVSRYNDLKDVTSKMKNQLATAREKKIAVEAKDELKKRNIERMNAGLKPIFVTNKNMKKLVEKKRTDYRVASGTQIKYEKQQRKKIRKGHKKQFKGKGASNLLGFEPEEE